MEFNEIVVKESPGLCRCCLSEGCYKDLGSEYTWMNEAEVYADMLLECFDISITQHNEGPNGPSRLICEVCITRLRDACNFKKQVLDSEKKFIDMLGRGEFRPKVLIYQTQMKTENSDEQVQEEVEYLEDDLDFDDDEVLKPSVDEHSSSPLETVTSETISLKRKLKTKKTKISRPKKHVEVDEKPKSSKAVSKGPRAIANAEESLKIKHLRDALKVVLEHTTAVPFERHGNYHKCFFCETIFQHAADLINHSQSHTRADLDAIDTFDEPVIKIDVTDLACKICSEHLHFKDLLTHLEKKHDVEINRKAADSIICFKLTDSDFKCLICEKLFKIFGTLLLHIHREHLKCNLFCEACGESFTTNQDLVRHTINSHSFGNCKCEYCDRKFININRRDRHVKLKHSVSYSCQYCNKIFKKASQRDRHMNQIHSLQIHPAHKCDRCSMVFKKKLTLSYHYKKVHLKQKNVTCEVCGMTFFDTRNLNLHKVRHVGDKPFECDTCHKKFTRKPALKLHVRIHTDERRYVCKMCGRAFVQWSALDGHLHIHSDERNFKCLICDKAFKTKKTLRKHSLTVHQKGGTQTVHQDL